MDLPEHVAISDAQLRAIARQYGVDGPLARLPETGIFNAHYLLGERLVLRVPRAHPGHVEALRRETIAVPAADGAGVRAPKLIAFDDTCAAIDSPFALYERILGRTLESLDQEPAHVAEVWRDLGRDLARLHEERVPPHLEPDRPLPDPRQLVEAHAQAGRFSSREARWLLAWLERLAPVALAALSSRFVHGDMQAANVLVSGDPPRYAALMDWGSACPGIAAHDFAGVPLGAVPFMLEGHREIAPLDDDATAEARIVWRHLQLGLWLARRGPQPGRSWAERPLGMLLETLRFFAAEQPEPWRGLGPLAP